MVYAKPGDGDMNDFFLYPYGGYVHHRSVKVTSRSILKRADLDSGIQDSNFCFQDLNSCTPDSNSSVNEQRTVVHLNCCGLKEKHVLQGVYLWTYGTIIQCRPQEERTSHNGPHSSPAEVSCGTQPQPPPLLNRNKNVRE